MPDEQAYLDALADVCGAPPFGAPESLRMESGQVQSGEPTLVVLRWSFAPYADDPRPRTAAGRIEGESFREIDPHPMNDFFEPEPLAEVLWHQVGLEADAEMRAAYDVEPGPVTDEHRQRALALIPSRDEWWQMFLDELATLGRVVEHDEEHVAFLFPDDPLRTFGFGPDAWFAHLRDAVTQQLAAGVNLERRGGVSFDGYSDDLRETLGSSGAPVLILGEHGLEPHPDHPAPEPDLPDLAGGRWVAYRPLDDAE